VNTTSSSPTPQDLAAESAARLRELTGVERHDIALVMGSGWLPAVDVLGEASAEVSTTDLISDHINLTGTSPVEGARFVDLTELYSPRLRQLCRDVDASLAEGVYVQFRGPHYETPAEIGMVRAIGGTLVGMSTTLEAIAARESGMEVLGISLVTNLAAGISGEPLDHEEVLAAGNAAASRMGGLLGAVVPGI
jgi:purine-nucleoside phosphorylase